jgi:hypothetical protein
MNSSYNRLAECGYQIEGVQQLAGIEFMHLPQAPKPARSQRLAVAAGAHDLPPTVTGSPIDQASVKSPLVPVSAPCHARNDSNPAWWIMTRLPSAL